MKFRLTYEGAVYPSGNKEPRSGRKDPLAKHKHTIRREFHKQLKYLWKTDQFLSQYRTNPDNPCIAAERNKRRAAADATYAMWAPSDDKMIPLVDVVADRHCQFRYRFVPLVTKYFDLLCSLHILFLRRDIPGSAIQAGDIDNRVKTLIDALRIPRNQEELVRKDSCPGTDEDPFFCLLEDDDLVSSFAVETDTLLDPPITTDDKLKVRTIVTVELRPYYATTFNLSFI